jgi:hypothetical protein
MKQKLLLLTITFLLLGSVSFRESIACDPKPVKAIKLLHVESKRKLTKAEAMPFDLFPFVQTFLLN